ncbi:hypothetical protein PAHAL_8G257400 [Panicum hallii]|jgi:hypothetical protein|uniref:Uncharacterized protein n=1 Tax=Panicum hallii TaxID=206008 RepID=A0A2T8IAA3_9POAL|nr:hypothetical protein PAHAL_8G257400 [Panicum hallii]
MANGKISATTEKGSSAKVVIGTSAIPLDNYLVVEPVHGRESEAVDESKGTAPFLKSSVQGNFKGSPRTPLQNQWNG